jgi:hypothetical protein
MVKENVQEILFVVEEQVQHLIFLPPKGERFYFINQIFMPHPQRVFFAKL